MKVEVKLTGVDGVLKTLSSLPAEVVSKRGGPAKAALAKGARFLRDRERDNLRAVLEPGDESTGLLEQNIIASRGKPPSSGKGERYLVRVKRKMYPGRKGEQVSTLKSAQIKEYGSVNQPARSFIRKTVQQHGGQTIDIVTKDLDTRVQKIVAKLAGQNRGSLMFPQVYRTLTANATVVAMVADRIGRHGVIQQTETRPYITWQILLGQPFDNLSSTPCGDFTTVQIDCYHQTDAGIQQLGVAVRAALDAAGVHNRVTVNNRDPDTKLYRVGLDADFITNR